MLSDIRERFLSYMLAHIFLGLAFLIATLALFTEFEPAVIVLIALFCVLLSVVVFFVTATMTKHAAGFALLSYVLFVGVLSLSYSVLNNDPASHVLTFPGELWIRIHGIFLILLGTLALLGILIVRVFSGDYGLSED